MPNFVFYDNINIYEDKQSKTINENYTLICLYKKEPR